MNRLKALFISLFIAMVALMALHAAYRLIAGGFDPAWLGAALAAAGATAFFARLYLVRVARTSADLPLVTALVATGAALALVGTVVGGKTLPAVYGAVSLGGWLLYDFWYSRFGVRANPELAPGRPLPTFDLETLEGEPVSSGSFVGRPTLLLFYRGNWCPFCMAQVGEVAARYRQMEERGIRVVLVSPQPSARSAALARKLGAPLTFLADPGNRAAERLGIAAPGGTPAGLELLGYASDTVLPTVLLTDASGRILFTDLTENYRVRPQPEAYLQIADEYLGGRVSAGI